MYSHVMVGTNDPDKARKFDDAAFAALGISGQRTPKGAFYGSPETGMFGVTTPRDEQPATHANGGTIGFKAPNRAAVDAWHTAGTPTAGLTKDHQVSAHGAIHRSTAPTCAIPKATSSAPSARRGFELNARKSPPRRGGDLTREIDSSRNCAA